MDLNLARPVRRHRRRNDTPCLSSAPADPNGGRYGDERPRPTPAGPEDAEEMRRLIDAWNPVPIALIGFFGFVVILWLMLAKPF